MNNQYINELMNTLEQTRIYMENGEESDYETGIQVLVECFTRHKSGYTDLFHRKRWKFRNCKSYDCRFYEKRRYENLQLV